MEQIEQLGEIIQGTRAHVIAWRDELQAQGLSPATIRRKLSALSTLFNFLCDKNSVMHNPVDGEKGRVKTAMKDQRLRSLMSRQGIEIIRSAATGHCGFHISP